MSFRSKVHDALNIVKGSVKLPIDEVLLGKQYVESKSKDFDAAVCIANTPAQYDIGGGHCQTLDHLTFVMGKPILPITLAAVQNAGSMEHLQHIYSKPYPSNSIIENGAAVETGAHYLGGLYDESNNKLRSIRKAAINPVTYER